MYDGVADSTHLKRFSVLEPLNGRSRVVDHALQNDVLLLAHSLLVVETTREVVQHLLLCKPSNVVGIKTYSTYLTVFST